MELNTMTTNHFIYFFLLLKADIQVLIQNYDHV